MIGDGGTIYRKNQWEFSCSWDVSEASHRATIIASPSPALDTWRRRIKKGGESRNEKGIIWLQNSRLLSGMRAQAYESVPHVCMCAFLAGNASSNMASSTLRPKP